MFPSRMIIGEHRRGGEDMMEDLIIDVGNLTEGEEEEVARWRRVKEKK